MDRQEKITYYCALFEKAYGEQPAGDLSTFTEDEINENINELQELLK
jgi:CO dehydrogenase/acetyl-CoA synthase alpha subunit